MALPALLSAIREIILDLDQLPEDPQSRISTYRKRFPSLSSEETEDLGKVQPEQFRIYTATIFTGEGNVLLQRFPISTAMLRKFWPNLRGHEFNAARFAKELHTKRPWKSNETFALVENFSAYVGADLHELAQLCPEIAEIVELEKASLYIKRAPDELICARSSKKPLELAQLQVSELMDYHFIVPSCIKLFEFNYDLVEAYRYFHTHAGMLPDKIVARCTFAAGGRNSDNFTRWTAVPEQVFRFLQTVPRALQQPLENLALSYISLESSGPNSSTDEARLFRDFFTALIELIESGVVVIQAPNS